jgi:hypothetical protein
MIYTFQHVDPEGELVLHSCNVETDVGYSADQTDHKHLFGNIEVGMMKKSQLMLT